MAEQHVRPNEEAEGGWVVTAPDASSVRAHTTTQGEAVDQARHALAGGSAQPSGRVA